MASVTMFDHGPWLPLKHQISWLNPNFLACFMVISRCSTNCYLVFITVMWVIVNHETIPQITMNRWFTVALPCFTPIKSPFPQHVSVKLLVQVVASQLRSFVLMNAARDVWEAANPWDLIFDGSINIWGV